MFLKEHSWVIVLAVELGLGGDADNRNEQSIPVRRVADRKNIKMFLREHLGDCVASWASHEKT